MGRHKSPKRPRRRLASLWIGICERAREHPRVGRDLRAGQSDPRARENFTFHGYTLWEICRYNSFMVELDTGRRTLRKTSDFESARTRGTAGDSPVAGRGRA